MARMCLSLSYTFGCGYFVVHLMCSSLSQFLDFFQKELLHSCRFSVPMGGSEFESVLCCHLVPEPSSYLGMVNWTWEMTFRSRRACPIHLSPHLDYLFILPPQSLSVFYFIIRCVFITFIIIIIIYKHCQNKTLMNLKTGRYSNE